MADSRALRRFPEWMTSRGGAWITLGVVLLIMTALFGLFGSAKAPAGNEQAPPRGRSQHARAPCWPSSRTRIGSP